METISWKFFILNASWSLVFAVVVWFVFIETKGKTLEEIDELFEGSPVTTEGVREGDDDHNGGIMTPSLVNEEINHPEFSKDHKGIETQESLCGP